MNRSGSPTTFVTREVRISIRADADVVVARQTGRELALQAELGMTDAALVAAAISELARNLLVFAGRGEMVLALVDQDGRRGIVVTAFDEGPGIPDVAQALRDGYSTAGGLGLGLPGIKRVMDEFDITSHVGRGTTVTAKKWKR